VVDEAATATATGPTVVERLLQGVPPEGRYLKARERSSPGRYERCMRRSRQPTMRRATASMTKATETKPCHVATDVKSATLKVFGRGAWNCRFTRSAGHGAAGRHPPFISE
jgi:hypothetical protein